MPSAIVSINTSGDNTNVIPSPGPGKLIRVYAYVLGAASAVSVIFKDSAPTSYSGAVPLTPTFSAPNCFPQGWFDLAVNTSLTLNLSGAVLVTGQISYGIIGGP
jgi:hypothetical protein